ncbi:MAG: hypothetical protein DI626_10375, partial [Micavibrio aeruginosavorus]
MFLKQRYHIISVLGVLIGLQIVQPAIAFSQNVAGLPEFVPGKVIPARTLTNSGIRHLHPKPIRKPDREQTEKVASSSADTALAQYFPNEKITVVWENERAEPKEPSIHITADDIPLLLDETPEQIAATADTATEDTYETIVWNSERIILPPEETQTALVSQTDVPENLLAGYVPVEMFPEDQPPAVKLAQAPAASVPAEPIGNVIRERVASTMALAEEKTAPAEEQEKTPQIQPEEKAPAAPVEEQNAPSEPPAPPAIKKEEAESDVISQAPAKSEDKPDVRRTIVELAPTEEEKNKDTNPNAKIPLKDVVAVALQSNPTIARSLATRELYEASLKDLQGQQEPQVAAFSNLSGEYDTSDESSDRFDDSLSAKVGVRLNYTLYNFGASNDRVEAGGQTVEQAGLQFKEAQESLAFDVISTY